MCAHRGHHVHAARCTKVPAADALVAAPRERHRARAGTHLTRQRRRPRTLLSRFRKQGQQRPRACGV
jgi:hypothetical protein